MDTILGLFGIVVWIVGTIALASAVTWIVVKISPAEKPPKKDEPATDAQA